VKFRNMTEEQLEVGASRRVTKQNATDIQRLTAQIELVSSEFYGEHVG